MSDIQWRTSSGRHRLRQDRRHPHGVRRVALVTTGVLVLAGCGIGMALGQQTGGACPGGVRTLHVAVTPELASIITEIAGNIDTRQAGDCTRMRVTASSSAAVARSLQKAGSHHQVHRAPDVWIPDSSQWLRRSALGTLRLPARSPSVARSPIVLAVAASTAAGLGGQGRAVDVAALLGAGPAGRPAQVYLPNPLGSSVAAGALLSLQATAARRPDGPAALTAALLGHIGSAGSGGSPPAFTALLHGQATAMAASEQQVWEHNRSTSPVRQVVAAYPAVSPGSLDYPFVVLDTPRRTPPDVVRLLAALRRHEGRDLLLAAGFRDGDGTGGPVLAPRFGVNGSIPAGPAPRATDVDRALGSIDVVRQGSRMLAVIDVSGSMGERVPGAAGGATRLDLTKAAAVGGLGVYPDDTSIGLWAFSTHLTPSSDYRELVPIGPLAASDGAMTGRQRLAGALAQLQHVPGGGTGLYDTALAATRRVRDGWEAGRVNSVVLLTDGKNDDDHGIGLAELLRILRAENDPQHPVPLITIAYGASSPVAALRAMSAATGGATYVAKDPRQVGQVFLEAIQQRACRPACDR